MSDLRTKINLRLDELEDMMNSNQHLTEPELVSEKADSIGKFWSVLSDEDKDYVDGVRWAIEEKVVWKDD
jgi:hypothetical protein